jgi:hypothetical protein
MLLGMPIVREMYVFTAVERPKRLGHNVWLGLGILVIEWGFIFKFGEEEISKAGCVHALLQEVLISSDCTLPNAYSSNHL